MADAKPRLVILLPARNCEADLPAYFKSAANLADAVVALDDGSTDRTAELLESQPLVEVLLRNPPRRGHKRWDDAANRNRLLAAAADLEPEWVLSLDADELIDGGDVAALRSFLARDALPGFAYGFPLFRMLEDIRHCDPTPLWVYRLFAFQPGQRFPDRRLHFVPVPTSIPRSRWLQTTIRIKHVGSLTENRRRARYEKYREADPRRRFQSSYENLLEVPPDKVVWARRPAGQPILVGGEASGPGAGRNRASRPPALSAIVISQNDEARIERAVRAVVDQKCPEPFEVIVVTSGHDRTAETVRRCFPHVTLIDLPRPALPGEARNAGLRVARGEFVSFPGSHVELPPGSLAARLRAHRLGYGMVTGTILNGTPERAGWASYFLDHSSRLPGRPSGELEGPPVTCSYARRLLLEVGGFPEDMRTGEDTAVNSDLFGRGEKAYRAQELALVHRSPCTSLGRLIRHHFTRGRGMGRILLNEYRSSGRLLLRRGRAALLRKYVSRRLGVTTENVERWAPDLLPTYRWAYPYVVAAAIAACAGTWFELLRPVRGKYRILVGGGLSASATDQRASRGPTPA